MQPYLRRRARICARAATIATSAATLSALLPGMAHAAPPGNDAFAGATPITSVPATAETALAEATAEPGEPTSSCAAESAPAPSTWFAFTAPRTEWVTLGVDDWSTVATVYTGESLDGLTELSCDSYDVQVFAVTAGQTYHIQLANRQPEAAPARLSLAVAPTLKTTIYQSTDDPSSLDTVTFTQSHWDNEGEPIIKAEWDFGDGATADGDSVTHRFTADGNYTVRVRVTSADGRTASATRAVTVRTHDVRVAGFTVPTAGRVGATKPIEVTVGNQRISVHATVVLYRSTEGDLEEIARATQYVPARPNRTVAFPFNYTFTPDDAALGKITFRTVVLLADGVRDVRTIDNEAIAPATTVRPKNNEAS